MIILPYIHTYIHLSYTALSVLLRVQNYSYPVHTLSILLKVCIKILIYKFWFTCTSPVLSKIKTTIYMYLYTWSILLKVYIKILIYKFWFNCTSHVLSKIKITIYMYVYASSILLKVCITQSNSNLPLLLLYSRRSVTSPQCSHTFEKHPC